MGGSKKAKAAGFLKKHKAFCAAVALVLIAAIVLPIALAANRQYAVGDTVRNRDVELTLVSVEYTDIAAGHIRADEGYMFVIFQLTVYNKSGGELCVSYGNFVYQNEQNSNQPSYRYLDRFAHTYGAFSEKTLTEADCFLRFHLIYQVRKEIETHTLVFRAPKPGVKDGTNDFGKHYTVKLPNSRLGESK